MRCPPCNACAALFGNIDVLETVSLIRRRQAWVVLLFSSHLVALLLVDNVTHGLGLRDGVALGGVGCVGHILAHLQPRRITQKMEGQTHTWHANTMFPNICLVSLHLMASSSSLAGLPGSRPFKATVVLWPAMYYNHSILPAAVTDLAGRATGASHNATLPFHPFYDNIYIATEPRQHLLTLASGSPPTTQSPLHHQSC